GPEIKVPGPSLNARRRIAPGSVMTDTKLFEKNRRVLLFIVLYGGLALMGLAFIGVEISKQQPLSGTAGFMAVFGIGMTVRTALRRRHPLVALHGDRVEINQTNRPEQVRYKDIIGIDQPDGKRLELKVRDGHGNRKITIRLTLFEKNDSERLVEFLMKRGWKR
ncbi:MAG TPA: hypothetical protein VN604_01490, partial [Nitrospirota bacterium]|nr:hypothetical protein [Nitrospirota bacterium]